METTKLKLWVDDLRDPETKNENGDFVYVQDPENWKWVKTITEAIRILSSWEVLEVSLDHDIMHPAPQWMAIPPEIREKLGETVMAEIQELTKKALHLPLACPENYSPIAMYIAEMPAAYRPTRVNIHTANPDGAVNMKRLLEGKVDKLTRRMALP